MTPFETLAQRVSQHLLPDLDEATFNDLALEVYRFHVAHLAPYRRLCESRQAMPETVKTWRDIPPVPVAAFKTLPLHLAPPREVFRSSGTTGGRRSVHYHPLPEIYRQVIDATFPAFCLRGLAAPDTDAAAADLGIPFLSLVPSRRQAADSSLGFMIDHVMRRHGGHDSQYAFGPHGVDTDAADAWCERRRQDGRPGLILATSFALVQWLDALAARRRQWRLPPGSAVFDTGGSKGKTRQVSRRELHGLITRHLALPPRRVVREYGMTELTSQFYTRSLAAGDEDTFVGPPWLRGHVLDPVTLRPVQGETPGLLAILDLANVGSVLHVLTQDRGVAHGDGFRLLGRASGAELRGCSLTVEELQS